MKPGNDSAVREVAADGHHEHRFHFNAIYSGIAGIIGLVCIGAVIVVTVYRIHLRRQQMRRALAASHGRTRERHHGRPRHPGPTWTHSTPYYQPPPEETYVPQGPSPTNVAVNINLQYTTGAERVVSPPPYSECEPAPREGTPPPPYSTLDRPRTACSRMTRPEAIEMTEVSYTVSPRQTTCMPAQGAGEGCDLNSAQDISLLDGHTVNQPHCADSEPLPTTTLLSQQ